MVNPGSRVGKEFGKAFLSSSARKMPKGAFIKKELAKRNEDAKKTGGAGVIGETALKRMLVRGMQDSEMPTTKKQRVEFTELLKETGVEGIQAQKSASMAFERYKKSISGTAKESGKEPTLSKAEQRKKEARHLQQMWEQARERRAEADKQKGGKVDTSKSAWREGVSKAEEAAKESQERGRQEPDKDDWRKKPLADIIGD